MKRTIAALGLAGVMLIASPAGAHLKSYEDGSDDAYQAGDINDDGAHVSAGSRRQLRSGRRRPTTSSSVTMQDPLSLDLLCSEDACSGKTIESHGVLNADFYRFVDDARKNWYFIEAGSDGAGGLVAGLFKVTNSGSEFVANATGYVCRPTR